MATLRISVLGPFQVWLDEKPVIHFESNKVRALLSYLAVQPDRQHRREFLADLLWPDFSHASALGNLRYTISSLQKTLKNQETGCLHVWRDSLQFNSTGPVTVDALEFVELLRASPPNAPSISSLEQAVSLYRGAFLEGFSLADCDPFEEWLLLKREQYTRLVLKILYLLADYYETQGDFEQAQRCAWLQIEIEPWLEEGYQQLMRALALGGRRSAALSQYDTCRKLLARELGIEPGRETQNIYEAICKDDLAALHSSRNLAPQHPLEPVKPPVLPIEPHPNLALDPPFVGFQSELTWLEGCLEKALAGAGKLVFISGDLGSGKTTLAHQFADRAMQRYPSLVVACGACSPAVGFSDTCLPFIEILQMLTGGYHPHGLAAGKLPLLSSRLDTLLPHALHILAEQGTELVQHLLSPELLIERARSQNGPLSDHILSLLTRSSYEHSHIEAPQPVIFEQFTNVLAALADRVPLLLILDDMQWADRGTTSLLFHLVRRLKDSRVFFLTLYRPGDLLSPETENWQPLELIIQELMTTLGSLGLDLDNTDKAAFFNAYCDLEPNDYPQSFRQTCFHITQGYPLFVIELLRGMQERGDLQQDASGAWIPSPHLDWGSLPPRLDALVGGRLHRLPEAWRHLLQAASIEGEQFTAETAARLAGFDPQRAVHTLGSPLNRGLHLVQPLGFERLQGQPISHYRFTIPVYQISLYNQMDEAERAGLHEQTARELESLFDPPPESIARQIANHYQQARQPEKAETYLTMAE